MMLITALEKQKGGWAVFVEGEYALMLDAETFVRAKLRAGEEITPARLDEIKYQSDLRRTRERALYLLETRAHSRKELFDKLVKTGGEAAAGEVTARMEELGLLDDADYAARLARQLTERKGYGEVRVRQELARRGIDRELIEDAMAGVAETADVDAALDALIARRYARCLGDEKGRSRAVGGLLRMGYRQADIRRAIGRALDALEAEGE